MWRVHARWWNVRRVHAGKRELMGGPRRARTAGRRIARRWCVPPAVMQGPGETVDGNGILGEVPGELGLLLWGTARDVALWGGSPPGERGKLFADGSGD